LVCSFRFFFLFTLHDGKDNHIPHRLPPPRKRSSFPLRRNTTLLTLRSGEVAKLSEFRLPLAGSAEFYGKIPLFSILHSQPSWTSKLPMLKFIFAAGALFFFSHGKLCVFCETWVGTLEGGTAQAQNDFEQSCRQLCNQPPPWQRPKNPQSSFGGISFLKADQPTLTAHLFRHYRC